MRRVLVSASCSLVVSSSLCLAVDRASLSIHLEPASYDGCDAFDAVASTCSDLVVEGDASVAQFAFVVAAGVGQLEGLQFGIEYDAAVDVSSWQLCTGGFQVPEDGWPDSGSAIAVTFNPEASTTAEDSLVVVGCRETPQS